MSKMNRRREQIEELRMVRDDLISRVELDRIHGDRTVADLCELTGLSERSVRRIIDTGQNH